MRSVALPNALSRVFWLVKGFEMLFDKFFFYKQVIFESLRTLFFILPSLPPYWQLDRSLYKSSALLYDARSYLVVYLTTIPFNKI